MSKTLRSIVELPVAWSAYVRESWTNWRLSQPYPERKPDESLGRFGERIAAVFLERQRYMIVERSYRIKSGEIDLIAIWQRRIVVFVEVKTWANLYVNTGGPSDAVDDAKQEKISRAAFTYMKRHHLMECSGRADVIEIVIGGDKGYPSIRHFENAFEAVGRFQMFS